MENEASLPNSKVNYSPKIGRKPYAKGNPKMKQTAENTEIVPGVFHVYEKGIRNMLLCKREGEEKEVHLHDNFELTSAREVRHKAVVVKGRQNEVNSKFTLVFGQTGKLYAVGPAVYTDEQGRTANAHPKTAASAQLIAVAVRESSKTK